MNNQIEKVRLRQTARVVRKLYLNLSEIIDINKLPIKLEYTFTEDVSKIDIDILKALGVIILEEDIAVGCVNEK